MLLDKADWHLGGEGFPSDGAPRLSVTHMGMFLSWAVRRNLMAAELCDSWPAEVARVASGGMSGAAFVWECCDGRLLAEYFGCEGQAFAGDYYRRGYLRDYEKCFGVTGGAVYGVEESRGNQARIDALLDERLGQWRRTR